MKTVVFEDQGQDFTEWDIENGVVVDCRPWQGWLWNGTIVNNQHIQVGDTLHITTFDGMKRTVNYPVVEVKEKE